MCCIAKPSRKRSLAQKRQDELILFNLLDQVAPGKILSYNDMTNAIGARVNCVKGCPGEAYWTMNRAVNMHLQQTGKVFDAVRKKGMKLLEEKVVASSIGPRTLTTVKTVVSKGIKRLQTVHPSHLTFAEKKNYNTYLSILDTMEVMTDIGSFNYLHTQNPRGIRLSSKKTFEEFMNM